MLSANHVSCVPVKAEFFDAVEFFFKLQWTTLVTNSYKKKSAFRGFDSLCNLFIVKISLFFCTEFKEILLLSSGPSMVWSNCSLFCLRSTLFVNFPLPYSIARLCLRAHLLPKFWKKNQITPVQKKIGPLKWKRYTKKKVKIVLQKT